MTGKNENSATLLVFLKVPQPGEVKTRIAASIGYQKAADLYRQWIGDVLKPLQELRGKIRIVGCYSGPAEGLAPWSPLVDEWLPQSSGDLGQRLQDAFRASTASSSKVLAIGTDCLEIDVPLIRQAIEGLSQSDVVLGPAEDGGYYLIGTAKYLPGLFEQIHWSTSDTLRDQIAQCERHGWSYHLLETKPDIDTLEDWERHQARKDRRITSSSVLNQPLRIAVIVPVLNEAATIEATISSLRALTPPPDRIRLADGGSTDDTARLARAAGAEVVEATGQGRGGQIAAALQGIEEEIAIIAHADMSFPPNALAVLRRRLSQDVTCPGGCFGHRFDGRSVRLRWVETWDYLRARYRGISYGDQAQFFRPAALAQVGGFPDQPIMEDIELSLRLRRLGRPCYLNLPVTVSARRFQRLGFWRTVWLNLQLRWTYQRYGRSSTQRLYERYYSR